MLAQKKAEAGAEEKAREGLRLLKEAVLEYCREYPDGIRPDQVRKALGLFSRNPDGKQKDLLLWGLVNLLLCDGTAERRKDHDGRLRIFAPGETAPAVAGNN
jgi:hypothetical protein